MSNVFGHKYELYVVQPNELIIVNNGTTGYEGDALALYEGKIVSISSRTSGLSTSTPGSTYDYITVDGGSLLITNPIQLEGSISYKNGKKSGQGQDAEFKLYNLSEDTLSGIQANSTVILKMGYETDTELPIAFVGQVVKVSTDNSPTTSDSITTILCKEGENVLKTVNIVRSFSSFLDNRFVINTFIDRFAENGIPLGGFAPHPILTEGLGESFIVSGLLAKEFTKFLSSIDFIWFISKGKLYVQPSTSDRVTDFLEVNADNVIGTIKPYDDKAGQSTGSPENRPVGVEFETFMNANIGLETYLNITYGDYQGKYKPSEVRFQFNWKQGPWSVKVRCQQLLNYEIYQGGA